ncbi:hypothetical protein ACCI51_03780 [Microbulbifer echini]|uniref:Uncharacterized protein n=1 Tax=Microbulbifer echini TaxID=1529067 RepID=A0ABV4NJP3_9GAMM
MAVHLKRLLGIVPLLLVAIFLFGYPFDKVDEVSITITKNGYTLDGQMLPFHQLINQLKGYEKAITIDVCVEHSAPTEFLERYIVEAKSIAVVNKGYESRSECVPST